jgi:hypothetical protein
MEAGGRIDPAGSLRPPLIFSCSLYRHDHETKQGVAGFDAGNPVLDGKGCCHSIKGWI